MADSLAKLQDLLPQKQLAKSRQIDPDYDAQGSNYFSCAQHSHLHSTDALQGLFPSEATKAIVHDTREDAWSDKIIDGSHGGGSWMG